MAAFLIAMGANPRIYNKNSDSLLTHELRQQSLNSLILTAIYDCTPVLLPLDKVMENASCSFKNRPGCGTPGHLLIAAKYEEYEEMARNPPSLQHLTRCTVRQSMGPKRIRQACYLPLPPTLKEYLLLGQEIGPYPFT